MDAELLTALIPDLLAAHPGIDWEFNETTDAFAIELHPAADPSRLARVMVSDSTEIFSYSFAGYYVAESAYSLDEKQEVLANQIGKAVAAVRGPTHVLLEWAGLHVVRSAINHDPGGDSPRTFTSSFPLTRLWWRARGKRFRREVLTFPALADAD